jgi:hypothetical protein
MPSRDFVYLDVSKLLSHYSNPTANWAERVRVLAETQLSFFEVNNLLRSGFERPRHITTLVLHFSDFTEEGQSFLMSQAVERWLESCDRKGTLEAYRDARGLRSRLAKFRHGSESNTAS